MNPPWNITMPRRLTVDVSGLPMGSTADSLFACTLYDLLWPRGFLSSTYHFSGITTITSLSKSFQHELALIGSHGHGLTLHSKAPKMRVSFVPKVHWILQIENTPILVKHKLHCSILIMASSGKCSKFLNWLLTQSFSICSWWRFSFELLQKGRWINAESFKLTSFPFS